MLIALVLTLAVQVLVALAVITVPVLAPVAAARTGVSAGYVGLFIGLVYGAGMVATVAAGAFVRRFGAVRVSQFGLLACALGLSFTALGTPAAFAFGALLIGIGYAPTTPASSHILARSTPAHRMALVFSLKQSGVPVGGALAGVLVPPLVLLAGWEAASLAVAAACFGLMAALQPQRDRFDADREAEAPLALSGLLAPLRHTVGDPVLRRLALCSFFFAALQLSLGTFLVTHLTANLAMGLVAAGLLLTVAQVAGGLGRIAWGAVADRSGRPVLVIALIGLGMAACAFVAALFTPGWPWIALAAAIAAFGATAIGWNGVFLAVVACLVPKSQVGVATGGALFFTYAGVMVGPPIFSLFVESGLGYGVAYIALGAAALASGLWLLLACSAAKRSSSASAMRMLHDKR